jgi:predicted neuraminidase
MFLQAPVFEQLADRPAAHCSTLAELADGTLLTAWFGGQHEMSPDVAILSARRHLSDEKWSAPRVIAAVPGRSLGQPVLLVHPGGELWLFFDVIMERHWTSAQPYWQRSADGGLTWQAPAPLLDYAGLMFRSRPLLLPGRIILPVYDERTWQARMLLSDDAGQTWRLTAPLSTPSGNIQPCLAALAAGHLLAYLRTGGKGGVIWRAESHDGGETWSQPEPTQLPNPNAGLDLLRLNSGSLVLAYNPSERLRTPLCVALAQEKEDWRWRRTLQDAPGEFSYPTLLQTRDEQIQMVYTYQREHIHFARFTEQWLQDSKEAF